MNKILLIEDEESIRGFLKINLKRNNFEVIEAVNGEEGLNLVRKEKPDIVILDIMLPGIDGFRVCRIIREENRDIGIIMLTAKGQDMDKIMGLEYGADDYIVKPFNPLEVVLRIKAILRRLKEDNSAVIKIDKYKLDPYSKKFYKDGKEIYLTPKEYLIVKTFMENPNRAFSRDELLDSAWGKDYFGDSKIIDVNIRRIRAKIEDNPSEPKYIETIWGMGYRWKQ
ncbi:response regulator transcription factor [Clostridium isatidis]|uniref:Stage 0 sporulation protein A homolog n=1 Tax=Clostridium isatidis TaxID=182773 RepID=A0A343JF01_9CLOT|nr:response regulator transcription factor [Clostridium isatidis]ASW44109.1 DNA-binding response regulator [Clostridium isatidis]NLZ35813.1 response regulator transcription factor [Clostridiales bacterium]